MKKAVFNTYKQIYTRNREKPQNIPWEDKTVPELLERVVAQRGRPGRALDVGCGTGVCASYLAQQGYQVTALDFIPEALAMAQERFKRDGVRAETVAADAFTWEPRERYDLVVDVGCLHCIMGQDRETYKKRLASWLAPGGDFVLVHFGSKHSLDWWPIGPRRIPREEIVSLFEPDYREVNYIGKKRVRDMALGRLLTGLSYMESSYHFKQA